MDNTHTFLAALVILFIFCTAQAQPQRLGWFDQNTDVGPVAHAGFAAYEPASQTYTVGGAGTNMWSGTDEFHYLWTTIQGDFILYAEAQWKGVGVDPHRKLGWIVKNNLDPHTEHVNAAVHGDGLTSLQYRLTPGAETLQQVSSDSFPTVIQLERRGNVFLMSTARFGKTLTTVQVEHPDMENEAYVGLYVCSHNPGIVETATFRNVRIIRPVQPGFQPYRDYIGSHLEVMEVATGHRQVLYTSAHSIQAPNWMQDGRTLLYNTKGRLYTYDLESGQSSPFNTGFATANNNDHVLSMDGKLLGISHHNAADQGRSTIYYLPATGADEPVQVTKTGAGHSYFHGWSPDSQKMIFTGQRKGQFDIYTVDVQTGKETQLTNERTLDDGPEYSPDGKSVYFNSVRTGTMKLWRMDADGKKPVQLTFDAYNDWFPHISPDGQWIVFISFPSTIDPNDHPFYQHCLLRMMPVGGGEPRVIGYVYGGQGTINVPSWSPDGRFIAFVTNSQ